MSPTDLQEAFDAATRKVINHVPDDVMEVLEHHDWPGNIRELQRESSTQQTRRSKTARSTSTSSCMPMPDRVDSEPTDRLN